MYLGPDYCRTIKSYSSLKPCYIWNKKKSRDAIFLVAGFEHLQQCGAARHSLEPDGNELREVGRMGWVGDDIGSRRVESRYSYFL